MYIPENGEMNESRIRIVRFLIMTQDTRVNDEQSAMPLGSIV